MCSLFSVAPASSSHAFNEGKQSNAKQPRPNRKRPALLAPYGARGFALAYGHTRRLRFGRNSQYKFS